MKRIKLALNKALPRRVSYALIYARYKVTRSLHRRKFLGGKYYCPVCDSDIKSFRIVDGSAWCPICESGERHRVDWIFMKDRTNLMNPGPKRMLHVAPEFAFIMGFRTIPNLSYVSGDLDNPRAMQRMDITHIGYPDSHFDLIYCSHVLEHIVDDQKAIRELYRVCRPSGWALLQVPISVDKTFEDPTAATDAQRLAVFGQEDHVRCCGLDYAERMREAGFHVTLFAASEFITRSQLDAMGILQRNRYVFYCTKPA